MALSTSARVSVASNLLALAAMGLAYHGWPAQAPLDYSLHKALHIAGVVIFGGNLVVGPLWIAFAWFSEDRAHLRFTVRTLVAADIYLTTPGLQLTVWNGLALASALGGVRAHPWLHQSMLCLLATSVISMAAVLPAQERLLQASEAGDAQAQLRAMLHWSIWGTLVSIPLGLVFWMMVTKSALG